MNSQKDMSPEYEPFRSEGVQYVIREEQRTITNSSRMKWLGQNGNAQLWTCLVVTVKSDAVKNNIA